MQARLAAFIDELAAVVGTLLDSHATVTTATATTGRQWIATLTAAGDQHGRLTVSIDHLGAAQLSSLVSGAAGEVEDASIADLLRNVASQAAAAVAARSGVERLDLTLTSLEPGETAAEAEDLVRTITVAESVLTVAAGWSAQAAEITPGRLTTTDPRTGNRIDVILDIDLPVVVRFGRTELPIRALSRLVPGSVIDLGRSPDELVDVLVSNRVVARGEVVIVGGNYGVRILNVTSQSERARATEA